MKKSHKFLVGSNIRLLRLTQEKYSLGGGIYTGNLEIQTSLTRYNTFIESVPNLVLIKERVLNV